MECQENLEIIQKLDTIIALLSKKKMPAKKKDVQALLLTDDGFESFWSRYPRKVGKPAAEKAWKKIKPDGKTVAKILFSIGLQATQWGDPKYIPHPATWLNQKRWEDEVGVDQFSMCKD